MIRGKNLPIVLSFINGWSRLWWLFDIRIGPAQCTTLSKLSRKYAFNGSRVQPTVLV